ncbi:hypothetical protein D3C87_2107830 [compost metagenome]
MKRPRNLLFQSWVHTGSFVVSLFDVSSFKCVFVCDVCDVSYVESLPYARDD